MIPIVVNGEERRLDGPVSVDDLVLDVAGRREGTAVAVDDEVVPRSRWAGRILTGGERVEVLTARAGG